MIGLKNTRTGHTLCDSANPIVLEKIEIPEDISEGEETEDSSDLVSD